MQGLRHECLSLVLADEWEGWLATVWRNLPAWAHCGVLFAVSGHHLKFPDVMERPGRKLCVLTGHEDFRTLLELGAQEFGLVGLPALADKTYSLSRLQGGIQSRLNALQRKYHEEFSEIDKALVASIKAALLNTDLAGSVIPKSMKEDSPWLTESLSVRLDGQALTKVADNRLRGNPPWEFQRETGDAQGTTTLLEAGCGGGKTVAAYLWASRHAAGRRLFFSYPTTTTASEGFAGYMHEPDFDALLVHSRAHVDYELLRNMPERTRDEIEGLEALDMWPVSAVVCTAHTVLGLMENVRRGLYAWPLIIQSAFVFDEVHAYSDRLFGYLLRFLQAFPGVPALLMTATLPPSRREALERACMSRGGIQSIRGPRRREEAPRYSLERCDAQQAWDAVCHAIAKGKSVLWVSNTIARAMNVLDEGRKHALPAVCFHSRFRYRDRVSRQSSLMKAFAQGEPLLATTTQVAEMSLDISADLLVSDRAPIPAMIQRLGRLNRFEETPATTASALFLEPESDLPYGCDALAGSSAWLDALADGAPRAQSDLAQAFVRIAENVISVTEPVAYCEWLDGLWTTRKGVNAIEEAGFSVEVVRAEDLGRGALAEMAIPMPFPKDPEWQNWRREGRYLVAPAQSISYDEQRGALWRSN